MKNEFSKKEQPCTIHSVKGSFFFQIGEKVIYDGLIATIEGRWLSTNNTPQYDLVSDIDNELTCSAPEAKCEPFHNQEIDESPALSLAYLESKRIQNLGESLTDKNFRDGNH